VSREYEIAVVLCMRYNCCSYECCMTMSFCMLFPQRGQAIFSPSTTTLSPARSISDPREWQPPLMWSSSCELV